jgi:hypothetical protein
MIPRSSPLSLLLIAILVILSLITPTLAYPTDSTASLALRDSLLITRLAGPQPDAQPEPKKKRRKGRFRAVEREVVDGVGGLVRRGFWGVRELED